MTEEVTVDAYIAGLTPERGEAIAALRAHVHEVVPDAVEAISYQLPAFQYRGKVLCWLASQKRHMALYMAPEIVEAHRKELAPLSLGKSCVRFRTLDALPLDVIRAMLLETVARIDAGEATWE